MLFDLTGQTAIVTGAAAGIGEAIARRLARAGAAIAVGDVNFDGAAEVAQSIGGLSFPVHIDITLSDSVDAAVAEILSRTGRIDILVNNAGIAGRTAPVWEVTDEDWQQIVAVNMTGVFYCCRAVLPHMRARRYGRIVNIASIAGKEVATEGICVNAVAPAVVRTKILEQLTQAQVDYMTERIPMRRTGTPEEIAAVVHFLASEDAAFVTGQCYDASGGRATY